MSYINVYNFICAFKINVVRAGKLPTVQARALWREALAGVASVTVQGCLLQEAGCLWLVVRGIKRSG